MLFCCICFQILQRVFCLVHNVIEQAFEDVVVLLFFYCFLNQALHSGYLLLQVGQFLVVKIDLLLLGKALFQVRQGHV